MPESIDPPAEQTIFDLLEVHFGDEVVQARPFEFETDDDDNFIKPLKASTTCPHCGNGQVIDIPDVGEIYASCDNCGAGQGYVAPCEEPLYSSSITVERPGVNADLDKEELENQITEMLSSDDDDEVAPKITAKDQNTITIDDSSDVQTLKAKCAFVDPIELGLFQVDEL